MTFNGAIKRLMVSSVILALTLPTGVAGANGSASEPSHHVKSTNPPQTKPKALHHCHNINTNVTKKPSGRPTPTTSKAQVDTKKQPLTPAKPTTNRTTVDTNCPVSHKKKPVSSGGNLILILAISTFVIASAIVGLAFRKSRLHRAPIEDASTLDFDRIFPHSPAPTETSPPLPAFLQAETSTAAKFAKTISTIHLDGLFDGISGGRPFTSQGNDSGAIWHLETGDGLYGALWSEKIAGHGEDAVPLLVVGRREGVVVGGVFDGLGGSGASRIDWDNGISVSHAWEAARICRYSLEHFLASMRSLKELVSIEASSFSGLLLSRLQNRSGELHQVQSGLSSSLARILPTTLAGFTIQMKGTPSVEAFWAGDSRTYLLDPQRGLQVLTIDDAAEMDAFESLNVDPPLSNVICADRPFVINSRTITPSSGFLVVAATDGCFNYWPTPANFEFEILEAIMNSATWESALDALNASIRSITKDDASLSLAAIGFKNFKALQSSLAQRHLELRELTYLPLAELKSSGGSREAFEEYRVSTWQAYKASYEMLLDVPS